MAMTPWVVNLCPLLLYRCGDAETQPGVIMTDRYALFLICILLTCLPNTYAQDPVITPSNYTPQANSDRQLILITTQTNQRYNIDALTDAARFSDNDQQVRREHVTSPSQRATLLTIS